MKRLLLFLLFFCAVSISVHAEYIAVVRNDLSSPDGKMRIVVFYRIRDSEPNLTLNGAILSKGEDLPDGEGNAFVFDTTQAKEGDSGYVRVSWKKDGGILVVYGPPNRVVKKQIVVRGVSIEYRKIEFKANQSTDPTA